MTQLVKTARGVPPLRGAGDTPARLGRVSSFPGSLGPGWESVGGAGLEFLRADPALPAAVRVAFSWLAGVCREAREVREACDHDSGARAGGGSWHCGGASAGRCLWSGSGRGGGAGGVGRAHRAAPGGGAGQGGTAVRVLRASLDGGLAGSGDLPGAATGPGAGTGSRVRADHSRVFRCRRKPGAAVGTSPAGRNAGGGDGRPGPRLRRDRHRGVRAGVLRQPVRPDGAAVRALRRAVVDAGGGRAGEFRRRG